MYYKIKNFTPLTMQIDLSENDREHYRTNFGTTSKVSGIELQKR